MGGKQSDLAETGKEPLVDDKEQDSDKGDGYFTKHGQLISYIGNSIGTGNIWRFPRIAALNCTVSAGAGAFLVAWSLFAVLWAIPLLMLETSIARYTRQGILRSVQFFLGEKCGWLGFWIIAVVTAMSAYYTVLMGWFMYYLYYCTFHELPSTHNASEAIFTHYTQESAWPVVTQASVVLLQMVCLLGGNLAIEVSNLIMVPMLVLICLILLAWALAAPNALAGAAFFVSADWTHLLSPNTWLSALTQTAFDVGAGAGLFIPLAAYMGRRDTVVRSTVITVISNNCVSFLSGMMIFAVVFSWFLTATHPASQAEIVEVLQTSGPGGSGLVFIWLPVLFSQAGVVGQILCCLLFVSLILGGLCNNLTMFEMLIQTLSEFSMPRHFAVLTTCVTIFVLGLGSSLSITFLTDQDFVWAFGLIMNGFILTIMAIIVGTDVFRTVIINDFGEGDWYLPRLWEWIIKFIVPIEAVTIISWWIIHIIITEPDSWYLFKPDSLMNVLTQWTTCLVFCVILNIILLRLKPSWFTEGIDQRFVRPALDEEDEKSLLKPRDTEAGTVGKYGSSMKSDTIQLADSPAPNSEPLKLTHSGTNQEDENLSPDNAPISAGDLTNSEEREKDNSSQQTVLTDEKLQSDNKAIENDKDDKS